MNISDEAVEAAAKAYYSTVPEAWDMTGEDVRRAELNDFRAALKAAVPHLLNTKGEK